MTKQQAEETQQLTKIRIRLSRALLKFVESTTKQDQTKSERICELIQKGLEVTRNEQHR